MIPKIIHYCWFGRGKMPELAVKCIDSWKKYLPDYTIKEWNEDTFDLNLYPYAKEAYEKKKYAFVTDVVRLYALYTEGGIYMDTDVEVLKSLDTFLKYPAFSGFESEDSIPTGIMASEKNGKWAEWQLSLYNDMHFILDDGSINLTTNVIIITNSMVKEGFKLDNSLQNFKDIIWMFPNDYFCPKTKNTINITNNTHCIHHFAGSWMPLSHRIKKRIRFFIGEHRYQKIKSFFQSKH